MRYAASAFKKCMFFSVFYSVLSSVPVAFIGYAKQNEENKLFAVIIPVVFWLGLIGEQFFMWRADYYRKMLENKNGRYPERIRGKPGIFSVFKTTQGAVADVLFLISLAVFAFFAFRKVGEGSLQYILIGFAILSFRLHCTFNGINYRYKKLLTKGR